VCQVKRKKREDACKAQRAIECCQQEESQERMALLQEAMMAMLGRLAGVTSDKPAAPSTWLVGLYFHLSFPLCVVPVRACPLPHITFIPSSCAVDRTHSSFQDPQPCHCSHLTKIPSPVIVHISHYNTYARYDSIINQGPLGHMWLDSANRLAAQPAVSANINRLDQTNGSSHESPGVVAPIGFMGYLGHKLLAESMAHYNLPCWDLANLPKAKIIQVQLCICTYWSYSLWVFHLACQPFPPARPIPSWPSSNCLLFQAIPSQPTRTEWSVESRKLTVSGRGKTTPKRLEGWDPVKAQSAAPLPRRHVCVLISLQSILYPQLTQR
jgi:hypothetical protein